MYKGTHVKKGGRAKVYMSRTTALLIAIVMIVGAAIGSTVAYLIARSDSMVNYFTYATVSCAVTENVVNGNSKNGVQVQNTGTTDAYIRADVVVNWIDADGKILPTPPEGCSYTIRLNPDGKWTQGEDLFYYYWTPVAPGEKTEGSLVNCTAIVPEGSGYKLSVEILATAVQSDPAKAVTEAWGVTPPSGN